jgi:flagellin-like hook-associated protein FlgL
LQNSKINRKKHLFNYLSYEKGILGAQMNRDGFIENNFSSQSLNLEKSKSDLIDADVGEVTAQFMKEKHT